MNFCFALALSFFPSSIFFNRLGKKKGETKRTSCYEKKKENQQHSIEDKNNRRGVKQRT
jgi:hypothetical protein